MHFTDYHTRLAAYCVVVEVRDGVPWVLLAWWNGEGVAEPCWSLPGGGVELDETCEEGAVREAREETGYDVALGPVLRVHTSVVRPPDSPPLKRVRVVYEATVTGGELGTLEVGGSTDRAAWLPLADVPDQPRSTIVDLGLTAWLDRTSPAG